MRDSPSDLRLHCEWLSISSLHSVDSLSGASGRSCWRSLHLWTCARFWKWSRDAVDVYFHPPSSATRRAFARMKTVGAGCARSSLDRRFLAFSRGFRQVLVGALGRSTTRGFESHLSTPGTRLRLPMSDVSAAFGSLSIPWVSLLDIRASCLRRFRLLGWRRVGSLFQMIACPAPSTELCGVDVSREASLEGSTMSLVAVSVCGCAFCSLLFWRARRHYQCHPGFGSTSAGLYVEITIVSVLSGLLRRSGC
jgi:hypothetical protein